MLHVHNHGVLNSGTKDHRAHLHNMIMQSAA